MKLERVVIGKHGMASLMLALKQTEIKAEDIPVHIHQGQTATQQLKEKDETPTVMVHVVYINEITTLCLPKN